MRTNPDQKYSLITFCFQSVLLPTNIGETQADEDGLESLVHRLHNDGVGICVSPDLSDAMQQRPYCYPFVSAPGHIAVWIDHLWFCGPQARQIAQVAGLI